jgi:hypothetical protein
VALGKAQHANQGHKHEEDAVHTEAHATNAQGERGFDAVSWCKESNEEMFVILCGELTPNAIG